LEIIHCYFPDDLLYDLDSNTWARFLPNGQVEIGITNLLSNIAGKMVSAKLKPSATTIVRGQSLGTLESMKSVGPIPSPVSGKILSVNPKVVQTPGLLNRSPYFDGWVARLQPTNLDRERSSLSSIGAAKPSLEKKVVEFRVRCFKAFPDHEMYEIGTECSAVILRLNELISTLPIGDAVHIVSDDPTAYVEMVVWTDKTKQKLVEWRKEHNLFHFVVEKVH
jgi:glycine cleavage system H protein